MQGGAIAERTKGKYLKYADDIRGKSWEFQPIGFGALGGFDEPARCLIDSISKYARDHSTDGTIRASTKLYMTRLISVTLAKWAAELVLRRMCRKEPLSLDC